MCSRKFPARLDRALGLNSWTTHLYGTVQPLSDFALSLGLYLLRRLQELVYNMRISLDFLRASTSPALPCLAHVRVFCRRLRGEDELAVLT